MDNILVDDVSLKKEIENLRSLEDKVSRITSQLSSKYGSSRSNLDEALQRDMDSYIRAAESYNSMIRDFVSNNVHALEERLSKLRAYNELGGE